MSMSLSVTCLSGGMLLSIMAATVRLRGYATIPGFLYLMVAALLAVMLAERWLAFGQGPFISLFELLVSSIFSLSLIYGVSFILWPAVRQAAAFVTLVLLVMGAWAWISDPGKIPLPATFGNPWLWVHVGFGKLFLGASLVAAGIAAVQPFLARHVGKGDSAAMSVAWRWLSLALVFHTGMLMAGAVWAQDAWGRYWGWDPLETWAFGTWLWMILILHARSAYTLRPAVQQVMLIITFAIAFLTFFGVPFISVQAHKGAI